MIRVAVIDDHYVVRFGLKFMMKLDKGITFAGDAQDATEVEKFINDVKPDVLFLDLRLPQIDGVDALKQIKTAFPSLKVIILTTSDKEEDIYRSIMAGADGYVLKDSKPAEMLDAIHSVMDGKRYMTEHIKGIFELRSGAKPISEREVMVLQYLSKGFSNPEIADFIGVTRETVKAHLKSIFDKLEVTDRVEAVSVAIARGIISVGN